MLLIISPAKNLDYKNPPAISDFTIPEFMDESQQLISKMKTFSKKKIREMMKLSENLAALNHERYHLWHPGFSPENAKQALFTFNGEVYWGIEAQTLSANEIEFAQQHLRILSGLHGVLKPLDLIQPYRLEMGLKLAVQRTKNLCDFWREKVTAQLNNQLKSLNTKTVLNLASDEYLNVVNREKLNARIISFEFKEWRKDKYKPIHTYLKRARGLMVSYIIRNKISDINEVKDFDWHGYGLNEELSGENNWVFTREVASK